MEVPRPDRAFRKEAARERCAHAGGAREHESERAHPDRRCARLRERFTVPRNLRAQHRRIRLRTDMTKNMTVNEAIGLALAEEMRRDSRVLIFGEGVATKRQDLVKEFGALRVRNTPLAEGIIAGTAV